MRKVYPQASYIQSIVTKKGVISHTNNKSNSNTLLSYESTPASSSTSSFSVSSYFYSLFPFFELKSNRNLKDGNTTNTTTNTSTNTNTNTKVTRISVFWMVIMRIPLILMIVRILH